MSYYYQCHIRNLETEAALEKHKIAAELHQKQLLHNNSQTQSQSRKRQTQQLSAHLQRSRLSSQLSAIRSKAQSSMNRSRLQSAFQLRKQNQKAMQELTRMDRRHAILKAQSCQLEHNANMNALASQQQLQETMRQQMLVQEYSHRQNLRMDQDLYASHRLASTLKGRYYYY